MKKTIVIGAAMVSFWTLANPADPQITSLNVEQNETSRRVTASYTLDEPAIITMDVLTNGVSIGGENIQFVSGDCNKLVQPTAQGETRTIYWQPDKSWPDHKFTEPVVSVKVTAWATNAPPDYLVVDLKASVGASRVEYYTAEEFLPGGLLDNVDYRQTKMVMRRILAKDITFTMGSVNEPERNAAREEAHPAKLTRNYYFGVFPVTQAQWATVTGGNPSNYTYPGDYAMRPVEKVSYNEIRRGTSKDSVLGGDWPAPPYEGSFLGQIRIRTGIDFDLPSEAEWEYAARAGLGDAKFVDGSSPSAANFPGRCKTTGGMIGNENPPADCTAENGTAIVGSYPRCRNSWGIYDVQGNVQEFCLDYWAENITSLAGAVNTVVNNNRVYRGGSWANSWTACRIATRSYNTSNYQSAFAGCRLVCTGGLQ